MTQQYTIHQHLMPLQLTQRQTLKQQPHKIPQQCTLSPSIASKSAQYNNSVTAERGSSTLTPTASYTDSQQRSSNYTQEYKENGETSNYTTTGPLTSPNYTTADQNYTTHSNAFDSYTTINNVTTKNDISITTSQISAMTHNTTTFISNYTTPEKGDNLTTGSNTTTVRNIYTTGYNTTTNNSDTTQNDTTTPSNNFTTNITMLSSSYTTMHSTTPSSDNTTSDSETIMQNYTTPHNFTNVSNKSVQYNTSETLKQVQHLHQQPVTQTHNTLLITHKDYNQSRETSNYTTGTQHNTQQ
ncbi:hypothetical protein FQA47_015320 [Oryzias melastigma]|uniref:Uncharacterized protein n=1 Tax=Oryzias melastigma TaxID=30732 RepID=A0A834FA85_ORYME|nr:hypothetical protein FQA47_015320 [Oryzias melastigma]